MTYYNNNIIQYIISHLKGDDSFMTLMRNIILHTRYNYEESYGSFVQLTVMTFKPSKFANVFKIQTTTSSNIMYILDRISLKSILF